MITHYGPTLARKDTGEGADTKVLSLTNTSKLVLHCCGVKIYKAYYVNKSIENTTSFNFVALFSNRQIWLTMFITLYPISIFGLFTWLDTIVLVCGRKRTKVTMHTNDEYELFTRVDTSKCEVTFVLRYAAAS